LTIEWIKIHPAIGIARLGNSPDEYFIGPEIPGDRSIPPGGYKDSKCRIKKQAARFRIFAHHSDGSSTEIQSDEADITWTVHLVNKKAFVNKRNATEPGHSFNQDDLIIDPGAKTLTGPNQSKLFDTGEIKFPSGNAAIVPLGEIRTDESNHLIVLGGFGVSDSPGTNPTPLDDYYNNSGWYDDTSDGSINATVKIRGTDKVYDAEQAWIIVAPPKFAPGIDNIITLYDRLIDIVDPPLPNYASYMSDIYPILERAKNTRWVVDISGFHSWPHPVIEPDLRKHIFSRLTTPDATSKEKDMPQLNEIVDTTGRLTRIQYRLMELWKDGLFKDDWKTPPPEIKSITAGGLDRAALENAVGGAFNPGIEAGGIGTRPILDRRNYTNLFRFNSLVKPGDITAFMALPWQADFKSCGENWWPVPHPNQVIPKGTSSYQQWDRYVGTRQEMVDYWYTLGFIVREGKRNMEGEKHFEVDVCPRASVTLITPHRDFKDTSQGPMGMTRQNALPILFEVRSTKFPVTFEFESAPSHPRLKYLVPTVTVGPTEGNEVATARLWITYETGPVGEILTDRVVIRNSEERKAWTVSITANTVPRKSNVVSLVLDHSQYMSELTGDGEKKYQVLEQASSVFVDTMLEGDGLALVSFDKNSKLVIPTTILGSAMDATQNTRGKIKNLLAQLLPTNGCSVLDGIYEGHKALDAIGFDYGVKTLLVASSGRQEGDRNAYEVTDFHEQIYSICLGSGKVTNGHVLGELSNNNKGYMLIKEDNLRHSQFLVQKYFLQIVGQVNGSEFTKDLQGEILPGKKDTVPLPFYMTEADSGIDVILLTAQSKKYDLFLITPNGFLIGPEDVESKISYIRSTGLNYYRIILPVELEPARLDRGGTWQAFLKLAYPQQQTESMLYNSDPPSQTMNWENSEKIHKRANAVPYYLSVHSYSSLTFKVWLNQTGYRPGASILLEASVFQANAPLSTLAYVWAEIIRPDGTYTSIKLQQTEEGRFSAELNTTLPGVYYVRVRCSGRSRLGYPFEREQSLTAAVWY
jgi:hypothetical protein